MVSAFVHRDETTPHIHFAFLPITADKKHGGKAVCKGSYYPAGLKDLPPGFRAAFGAVRDWEFEILNEATKDGNKTVAELKKQTAHEGSAEGAGESRRSP